MREKICIITAHYYQKITSDLYNGATLVLNKHKISSEWIKVPGVFEIPVTIVKNIKSMRLKFQVYLKYLLRLQKISKSMTVF